MTMNPLEKLQKMAQARFPEADAALDAPDNPEGSWWVDVALGEQAVMVEWRPSRGFGVSARLDVVRPDEVFDSLDETFNRVESLLVSGAQTSVIRAADIAAGFALGAVTGEIRRRSQTRERASQRLRPVS